MGHVLALCVSIALAAGSSAARAQVIDRILAVVDGVPITQSDVAAAMRLGLVRVPGTADPSAAVLDRLIERRLMLAEVERYAPPVPADADVDRRGAEIRSQVGAQFEAILEQTGMSLDQLRHYVRDDLRIDTYLQQRFGAIVPSEQDILQYYREHAAEFPQATFDQAHDRARGALVAERRAGTIRDWVAGLRRRANINVLPR
jgi:parvulin-like peptidyl-prolyl isomerase